MPASHLATVGADRQASQSEPGILGCLTVLTFLTSGYSTLKLSAGACPSIPLVASQSFLDPDHQILYVHYTFPPLPSLLSTLNPHSGLTSSPYKPTEKQRDNLLIRADSGTAYITITRNPSPLVAREEGTVVIPSPLHSHPAIEAQRLRINLPHSLGTR